MRPMVRALGIDESRVMRVHTELPLVDAAGRYDSELAKFFEQGGHITLGVLGLGADGHVASLFTEQDLARSPNRYAVAVPREPGPNRISVTQKLLLRAESLVFLVAGPEKADIVRATLNDPESTVAGKAVRDVAQTEIWYSHAGRDAGA